MKKMLYTMVRDDLAMLTLSAPTDDMGAALFSKKQRAAVAAFRDAGHHDFEWLHWVILGRSQLGGPLRGKFLKLHKDLAKFESLHLQLTRS